MSMIDVSLIIILWKSGGVVAGIGLVGSRSRRELPGLCVGLPGRRPVSVRLLTESVDRGVEGEEEVIWIERADEFIALELLSDMVLEFGEHEGGATGVEFLVELGEHVGGGGIDVGHRLCGDENPARSWLGSCEAADLIAKGAGIGEEQGCIEPEDHEPGEFLSIGVLLPVVLAGQPWDAAECGLVRPPCSSENVENRERHGNRDTRKDSEQCHT